MVVFLLLLLLSYGSMRHNHKKKVPKMLFCSLVVVMNCIVVEND